jgi:hypothetical protein
MKDGMVRDDIVVQNRLNATAELEKMTAGEALEVAV